MSDDTPTQRFDAPLTPSGAATPPTPPPDEAKKTSRGLIIALIAVGAILVIALIVLLLVLLRGNGTPTAAVTPTPTATASSSPAPTPTPTVTASASPAPTSTKSSGSSGGGSTAAGPSIASFTANPTTVACPAADAVVKSPTLVHFRWSTSNVDSVEFGLIGSDGSYQTQDSNLSPQGTDDSDLPGSDGGWAYPCGTHSVTYVLKATGDGQTKTARVVVTDVTY